MEPPAALRRRCCRSSGVAAAFEVRSVPDSHATDRHRVLASLGMQLRAPEEACRRRSSSR
jgi:hypothetical protein